MSRGVGGCCYGYWSTWDGHFVHSVPYYEQLVAELNLAILKAHFSRMEAMEKRGGVVDDPTAEARKRTSWRGCFWRVDPQESDDDEPQESEYADEFADFRERHARLARLVLKKHEPWVTVAMREPPATSLPDLKRRVLRWCRRVVTRSAPAWCGALRGGCASLYHDFVKCGTKVEADDSLQDAGFRPSGTAFVTFRSPAARVHATSAMLSRAPFSMRARDAPEPRDIIWANVAVSPKSVSRRLVLVNCGLALLLMSWTAVVSFCSNAPRAAEKWGWVGSERSWVGNAVLSNLPSLALLGVMNLLPVIFKVTAHFYERRKSHSDVDLSVIKRYFMFQYVNVYVSLLSGSLLSDWDRAWDNPLEFVEEVGANTPVQSLYFIKFLLLSAGLAPCALMRAWPLISRGFKYWTVQPPDATAFSYGDILPRLMMAFTIFATFWIFAPLISLVAFCYFSVVSVVYRYLLLYCHMPKFESGGAFFFLIIDRILFGVIMSNAFLFFWLVTRSLFGYALLVLPLPFVVVTFKAFSLEAYEDPCKRVALDEAVARTTEDLARATKAFDASTYAQPSLRRRGGDIEHTTVEHCGGTATRWCSGVPRERGSRGGDRVWTTTHRRP